MGFRLIQRKRKVKKSKSRNAQEVLDRLRAFLDGNIQEPAKMLCGFWKDQQDAISYQELRQAVKDGYISEQTIRDWQSDYSVLVKNEMASVWKKSMEAGPYGQPIFDGKDFELNMQTPGVLNWINERGAEFVTASTDEQREAIAALLEKKMVDSHTVDELAKMIRPCIGLTAGQAKANARYYDSVVSSLKKDHPRMSADSIRKKALDASTKYAERQHRQRALTIAQTECAFAYNRGADEGVRQAMSSGLLGVCKKVWSTSGDDGVCPICSALEGTVIGMDNSFGFTGRELFTGHKMLPPAHPLCACAVEYVEVELPQEIQPQIEGNTLEIESFNDEMEMLQREYNAQFENQKLPPELYMGAAEDMAEVGYDYSASKVVEMVDSVRAYTESDFTDILAAQANFGGRFEDYAFMMEDAAKEKAIRDAMNIENFLEASTPYEGKVYRGLAFDVGGEMDNGSYFAFRKQYIEGNGIVEFDTMSSWSSDAAFPKIVHAERGGLDEEAEYVVEVTIRSKNCITGVDISKYAEIENQKEVLFGKGATFEVENISEKWIDDERLQIVIDMKEL